MAKSDRAYSSFVRLTCMLVIIGCVYFATTTFFDRSSSVGTSPRELFSIGILVAACVFLAGSFYRGKFNWLLAKQFRMAHILLMLIVISGVLAIVSQPLNYFRSLDSKRVHVQSELNHQLVRDSGLQLLAEGKYKTGTFLQPSQFPSEISDTSPTYLRVHDGTLIVGYGGEGYSDFGLVIYPDDRPIQYGLPISRGVSYYDCK